MIYNIPMGKGNKGLIFITDGTKNKMIPFRWPIPEGWSRGQTKVLSPEGRAKLSAPRPTMVGANNPMANLVVRERQLSNVRRGDNHFMKLESSQIKCSKTARVRNGGIPKNWRDSREYKKFTRDVLVRDNNTCTYTGCTTTQSELDEQFRLSGLKRRNASFSLHVHHPKDWDNYPELRFVVENGRTVCPTHHRTMEVEDRGRWLSNES